MNIGVLMKHRICFYADVDTLMIEVNMNMKMELVNIVAIVILVKA